MRRNWRTGLGSLAGMANEPRRGTGWGPACAVCRARWSGALAGSQRSIEATAGLTAFNDCSIGSAGMKTACPMQCSHGCYVTLHDPEDVPMVDETGLSKGGKRQYSGTANWMENCQIRVFFGVCQLLRAGVDRSGAVSAGRCWNWIKTTTRPGKRRQNVSP